MRIISTFFSLLLLLGTATLIAQNDGQAAIDYLQNKHEDLGLTAEDVAELEITDNYVSPGGVRHIYVNQQYRGLSVNNAQAILHFRGDRLLASNNGFVAKLADYNLPLAPAVSAQQAISEAVNAVSPAFGNAVLLSETEGEMSFSWSAVSPKPLLAKLVVLPTDEGLSLAWRIIIDQHADRADYWLMMVDAINGDILDKDNLVLKCDFGTPDHEHNYNTACAKTDATAELPVHEQLIESYAQTTTTVADGASYRVFPFGEESPIHSAGRVLEVDPADSIASPFGWHDTNGVDGPEFTITRGNNVYAYPDRDDNDDTPDPGVFADGGDELVFDYYFAENENADTILNASLTQVFYTTNKVHDWLFQAGFDEESGNFQRNNYKGGGEDRDPILAEAQDGSGTNNANFFTPADGQSGVMQMFLWEAGNASVMTVTEPASVSGPYDTGTAGFGPVIGSIPTTGQLVEVTPALACDPVTNGSEIAGKMALITRGICNFSLKVFNAQEAGAIGVVICNDAMEGAADGRGGTIGMSNGNPELTVTIPSVFLSFENCQPLRVALAANDSISVTFESTAPPPRDGDFDNGIVAHEIGHGVSNRLVGGPSNIGCVFNGESMGEGWSDFFTLASTPQTLVDTPDGSEPRGIGNYSTRRAIDGGGIREKLYSTDFAINDFTYDNFITANNASPHNRGEVWAVTLWDLYWAMAEEYGYDDDLIHGTGGNNKAVELVIEGMKATRCGPGAIDGRDGILQADELINDGANQCLIWEVFARRGMGFSADQGSAEDPTDNTEAFDLSPYCIGGVQLTKAADVDVINAGEGVTYTLRAASFRDTVSMVTITDQIPAGMTFEEGSVRGNDNFTVDGNTITFNVGEMEFEDEETIIYSVTSDPDLGSTSYFFDGSEDGDDNWELENLEGNVLWEQTDTTPYEGVLAWYIVNVPTPQDQVLRTFEPVPVTGDNPALRFFTKYETEAGWDAGIVEISTDNSSWTRVPDNFIRGGYRGEISEIGAAALQGTTSFWGNSGGYIENIIDLSAYANQDIYFRFRFISDAAVNARGWWIDNIELLDVVNYESAAILTSDQGDNFRAEVGNLGVLALGGDATDTDDPQLGQTQVSVFPNPANEVVNVNITAERAGDATVQLFSIDGRAVFTNTINLAPGATLTTINTTALPAGVYVVQVTGESRVSTTKVTIQ